jgi:hypothetical protein
MLACSLCGPWAANADEATDGIPAKPPADCNRNPAIAIHYQNAYKTLKQADDYKPGLRGHYVEEMDDKRNEYLLAGISPKFRASWFASHKLSEKDQQCFIPVFDALNAAAKRTLATYTPHGYDKHEGNEDDLIRGVIKQKHPGADVISVGTKGKWDINKLGNGVPKNRYKYGMAWVKSAEFDDGYCRIVHVNIFQDYAGGGTYADSRPVYINALPAGCQ